jgi:hypothetical protein
MHQQELDGADRTIHDFGPLFGNRMDAFHSSLNIRTCHLLRRVLLFPTVRAVDNDWATLYGRRKNIQIGADR